MCTNYYVVCYKQVIIQAYTEDCGNAEYHEEANGIISNSLSVPVHGYTVKTTMAQRAN